MKKPHKIHIAFLPVYQNPYQHLLTEALSAQDVKVIHLKSMPSSKWLLDNRNNINILHFHWLSGLYLARWLTPIKLVVFLSRVLLAHFLNYHIVWTAHNVLPHNKPFKLIHSLVRKIILKFSAAVITHCNYGKDELKKIYMTQAHIYVIPHGNYHGIYDVTMTREVARSSLNIQKDQFVYLMIGNISEYKGVDNFIHIFQEIASNDDVAIIAGRNRAPNLVNRLIKISESDIRIRVYPGYVPDEEMQRYLLASDVAVFAFKEILTSGTVILCLTYGLPVIAPTLGCLPELITKDAGILYTPNDPSSFAQALLNIKKTDLNKMCNAARAISQNLQWDDIAAKLKSVYLDCLMINE